jgi:hypothetical protein
MVGPFPIAAVDDYVIAKLVAEEGVPITLHKERDSAERYAILAPPGKDMRVVCVGCFHPEMTLFNDSRCKKVSSYCQHWDMNKGARRNECNILSKNAKTGWQMLPQMIWICCRKRWTIRALKLWISCPSVNSSCFTSNLTGITEVSGNPLFMCTMLKIGLSSCC